MRLGNQYYQVIHRNTTLLYKKYLHATPGTSVEIKYRSSSQFISEKFLIPTASLPRYIRQHYSEKYSSQIYQLGTVNNFVI